MQGAVVLDSMIIFCLLGAMDIASNSDISCIWRSDNSLEEDLAKYVARNLPRKEIVKHIGKDYPLYPSSLGTLDRMLRHFGIHYIERDTPEQAVINAVKFELKKGKCLGYRAMNRKLRTEYNIKVSRQCVSDIVKFLDPEGVEERTLKCKKTKNAKKSAKLPIVCDSSDRVSSNDFEAFQQTDNLLINNKVLTNETSFNCLSCGKSFIQKKLLIMHLKAHISERPYACASCRKSFHQITDLSKHVEDHRIQLESILHAENYEETSSAYDLSLSVRSSSEAVDLSSTATTIITTDWNKVTVPNLHSSISPIVINIKPEED